MFLCKKSFSGNRGQKVIGRREGDMNTRYFHAVASARKKANKINKLQDDMGT